jgi:hypothetical protein
MTEDTSPLKEIAKYGAGISMGVAVANPIVGGVGLIICALRTLRLAHSISGSVATTKSPCRLCQETR